MQSKGVHHHVFCGQCVMENAIKVCKGWPMCDAVTCGKEACAMRVPHSPECPLIMGDAYGLSLSKTGEKDADKAIESMVTLFETSEAMSDPAADQSNISRQWVKARDAYIRAIHKRVNPSKLKGDAPQDFEDYKDAMEAFLNALWRYGPPGRTGISGDADSDPVKETGKEVADAAIKLFGATDAKFRSIMSETDASVRMLKYSKLKILFKRIWIKSAPPGYLKKLRTAVKKKFTKGQ